MVPEMAGALTRRLIHFGDIVPIDQIADERLEIVGTTVAVIDVVTVLPDIAAEDRPRAVHQRAFAVRRFHDLDLAEANCKPAPSGTELCDAGLDEVLLHLRHRSEVGD